MLVRAYGVHKENNSLKVFCDRFCLHNLINEPTRVTKQRLYLMLSSLVTQNDTCGNLHLGVSDHDLVYAVQKDKLPRHNARVIEYRSMQHYVNDQFLGDLSNVPWGTAYIYDDVDDLWRHWASLCTEVLDKHAPIKKIRVRGDQLPWITPDIQCENSRRNRMFKQHVNNSTKTSWEEFKKQRTKVTSLKRKGMKLFCMETSMKSKHHGEFWKKMRPLLPSSGKNQSKIVFIDNERMITDSLVVAETFNNYFSEVTQSDSACKIMEESVDHLSIGILAEQTGDQRFQFAPVKMSYIGEILDNLNPRKAFGFDKISQSLLRLSSPLMNRSPA